jgi:UDP-N-acetylglucosamine:LPS N-acetylglucosamine transferase
VAHRVLIISASMGAGHDGAARELARRLREEGHEAEIRDFLKAPPWPVGTLLQRGYAMQIRHLAWTYELTYRFWCVLPRLCGPLSLFIASLTQRRMRRWADDFGADIVVSTYPLASQGLGVMRQRGTLKAPAVTFLTDFAVHPVWVHPAIDLHIAVHPGPASAAARQSGGPVVAPGPLVSPRFRQPVDREAVRAGLGLAPDDKAVFIVAGSWGVGAIADTFELLRSSGRYVPIVACGRDQRLRRRLLAKGGDERRILGWTDQMPAIMAAADAVVENAGGLTSMEAVTAAVPVISYLPIAGHGKANTRYMEECGVARQAETPEQLLEALDALTAPGPERDAQLAAGRAMLVGDAAADVIALADAFATGAGAAGAPAPAAVVPLARPKRLRAATLGKAAAVLLLVLAATVSADTGFSIATAHGLGVARPAAPRDVAYLAVRVDDDEVRQPAVLDALQRLHATAVVDRATAQNDPDALRRLAELHIDVQNGGSGHHIDLPWRRAHTDVVQSRHLMQRLTGQPVRLFVPARHIDGIDLIWCRGAHSRAVVPSRVLSATGAPGRLTARRTYLVDGREAAPAQVVSTLGAIGHELAARHLRPAPLSELV